ncbi:MAG: hypothetical protein V3S52_09570 [Gemmatimonadota bacterium]
MRQRPERRWPETRSSASWLAVLLLATAGACTEEAIVTGPDGPGATIPTVEVSALASELAGWRDTTFLGYALPATFGFSVLADRVELRSRVLGRFDIPDSVLTAGGEGAEIETFESAILRVVIDTTRSAFALPYLLELYSLTRSYDSLQATWTLARDGDAWTTPGGDLGALLASTEFDEPRDTAFVEFIVPVDSLLQGWRASDGEPGFALVVFGDGSDLAVSEVSIRAEVTAVDQTDTVTATARSRAVTFIYDPPQPDVGLGLRLAGLPSARIYLEFEVPEEIGGVPLDGATINHAELVFQPLAAPAPPFELARDLVIGGVEVEADPFEVGSKVPVGPPLSEPNANFAQFITVTPDELKEGVPLRINLTDVMGRFVRLDTLRVIRIAVRPAPADGQTFGFWEFGSVESPLALQPELLLLVTPRPGFDVP